MLGRPDPVVVADGDKASRALVAQPLLRAGYETIEVESGVEALNAVRKHGAALVLLEVALPDMTGYDVCRELRLETGDDLPIMFVSGTHADSLGRVAALLLGADDFIVKPFDPAELLARAQRLVRRRSGIATPRMTAPAAGERFTARESQVLDLLAEGLRQKDIALQLSISPKTVGTHIQNMFGKVGVHSRAQLVASAYRLELVGRA
jgi:DNA-binding NarL/FixJ family response regulator